MALVYVVTNLINGKRYIGMTTFTLQKRWAEHRWNARYGSHLLLCKAIRRYGAGMFRARVVAEYQTDAEALTAEVALIEAWRPEYNLTRGGEGVNGYRFTPEVRVAMSAKAKERWRTHRHPMLGKARPAISVMISERNRTKPVRFWLGKKRSAETKAKISATKRARRA